MARGPDQFYTPVGADTFRAYLNPRTNPPLDTNALSLRLMIGDERKKISSATNGDWSLVLQYKEIDAYVASFEEQKEGETVTLELTQLQGGKKGYRVLTSMNVLRLFTDQLNGILEHPENPYNLIVMPRALFIVGIMAATEEAILRYEIAARKLGLKYSEDQGRFVRKLK